MGLAMMSQGSVLSGLESRSGEKVAAEADNVQNDDQTDVAVEKMECSMFPVRCVLDGIRILL